MYQKSSEIVKYVLTANTSHSNGDRNCGQIEFEFGSGNSHQPYHTRPMWISGNNPAQITAMTAARDRMDAVIAAIRREVPVEFKVRPPVWMIRFSGSNNRFEMRDVVVAKLEDAAAAQIGARPQTGRDPEAAALDLQHEPEHAEGEQERRHQRIGEEADHLLRPVGLHGDHPRPAEPDGLDHGPQTRRGGRLWCRSAGPIRSTWCTAVRSTVLSP